MKFFFNKISKTKNKGKEKLKSNAIFVSGILFGIIPFLFIVYLLLGPVVKVIQNDIASETMIVISENLNIRSDKVRNSYVIGSYPFGTEVQVYQVFDNNWAEVSVGEKKGYMSFEFLVLPETFYIIEGMFGNENAQNLISSTKYRMAISNYLNKAGFTSKISKDEREKLYGKNDQKEVWQIFAESLKFNYNSFCAGDYNGDGKKDVAFIITNIKTGNRKLAIINVDADFSEQYGELITFKDLKENYLFIKHIPKNYKMSLNDTIQRINVDAVLIGTNRDKNFNDIPELMIYNGKIFDFHKQIK